MKTHGLRLLPCLLFLTTVPAFCATPTYTMTDLGTISGMDYSVGRAINGTAQTTGASGKNNSYVSHVFVNTNGSYVDLGTLGGCLLYTSPSPRD